MPEPSLPVKYMAVDGGYSLSGALIVVKTLPPVQCLPFWTFCSRFWIRAVCQLLSRCMSQQFHVDTLE